jgi:tRNA G46 methylase TrmB
MKTKILSVIAVVAMMWGAGVARESPAQTRSEMPMEQASPGHQMNGSPDGTFHHRFEDAEKWAKEFDNPERDAWQKPEEILDALRLQRTSLVADIGAGTGYFSVRIAKHIPEGKIFAADIEPDMVRYLIQRGKLSSNNTRPETNVVRTIGAHLLEPWSFQPPSSAGTSKSSSPGSGGAGG